jgi:hypothetical protein
MHSWDLNKTFAKEINIKKFCPLQPLPHLNEMFDFSIINSKTLH